MDGNIHCLGLSLFAGAPYEDIERMTVSCRKNDGMLVR